MAAEDYIPYEHPEDSADYEEYAQERRLHRSSRSPRKLNYLPISSEQEEDRPFSIEVDGN